MRCVDHADEDGTFRASSWRMLHQEVRLPSGSPLFMHSLQSSTHVSGELHVFGNLETARCPFWKCGGGVHYPTRLGLLRLGALTASSIVQQ